MTKQNFRTILMLGVVLCTSLFALAGNRTTAQRTACIRDFVYITATPGAQRLFTQEEVTDANGNSSFQNISTINNRLSAGIQLGVGYRFMYNSFLLSTGVEGHYGNFRMYNDSLTNLLQMSGETKLNAVDIMHSGYVNVPLMIGAEVGHFYFQAGPKLSVNICPDKSNNLVLKMDDGRHLLDTVLAGYDPATVQFRPQLYACAEIGCRLGTIYKQTGADVPYSKVRYYLTAYAEYGVLNSYKHYETSPRSQGMFHLPYTVNPRINNLFVGLRFTVAFEMAKRNVCPSCKAAKARWGTDHRWNKKPK